MALLMDMSDYFEEKILIMLALKDWVLKYRITGFFGFDFDISEVISF